MSWQPPLYAGEQILWRGRPAPRCYTFRHWRLNWVGVLLICLGLAGWPFWPAWLGLLPLIAGLLLTVGLPVFNRCLWGRVDYILTDRRLHWRGGLLRDHRAFRELADLADFRVDRLSPQLASVRLYFRADARPRRLFCLEYPQTLTALLTPLLEREADRGFNSFC